MLLYRLVCTKDIRKPVFILYGGQCECIPNVILTNVSFLLNVEWL